MLKFPKTSKTTTAHGYLLYAHSKQTKSTQNKPKGRQRTHGKSSEQRQTQRKRDRRKVERAVRDRTETGRAGSRAKNAQRNKMGRRGKNRWEMRSERNMLADHCKNSTKHPSRNSRTNLSHTLGRSREATARQSSIVHYGAENNN